MQRGNSISVERHSTVLERFASETVCRQAPVFRLADFTPPPEADAASQLRRHHDRQRAAPADKESGDKSPPCPALLHNSTQNLNHEEQTVFPLSDPARRKPALPCPVRPEIRERRSACLPIRSMLLLCKIYSLTFCVCYQTKQSCAVNRNMLKDLSLFIYLFQYIIKTDIFWHAVC